MATGQRRRHHAQAAAFINEYLPLVWCYVAGMLDDPAEACEVTRSVLVALDPPLLAEDDATALRRLLLARARRGLREVPASRAEPAAPPVTSPPVDAAPPAELQRGVAALDADEREALLLLDILDLDVEEAAALCGTSSAELQRRRHRAHVRLVDRLVGTAP